MTGFTPQDLANLWYLKFGEKWVNKTELDKQWKDISKELMRNNFVEYDLLPASDKFAASEILKLKNHANS